MKSIHMICEMYCKTSGVRLGQWFCNNYVKVPFPELYYCEDDNLSKQIIKEWLVNNCYFDTLPETII